jgi:hypothetical protein
MCSATVNEEQTFLPKARKENGQTAYKRQLAYAHLGIDPKDVESVPFLGANLRRIARCINQGRAKDETVRPLDYLRSSEDPEARKVVTAYLSVPESYRRLLPAEAFCHAAGVSPWRVLEIIAGVAVRQAAQGSAIIAAVMHPRVVVKTVERALQNDGVRERMMLYKAMGFLPMRLSNLSAESTETRDSIA